MPPALTLTLGAVRVAPWQGGVWNWEREVGEGGSTWKPRFSRTIAEKVEAHFIQTALKVKGILGREPFYHVSLSYLPDLLNKMTSDFSCISCFFWVWEPLRKVST